MYVTIAFHNNLKASSERDIIDCPPHNIAWFKLSLPTMRIEPSPDVCYVMEIRRWMQGTKPTSVKINELVILQHYFYGNI